MKTTWKESNAVRESKKEESVNALKERGRKRHINKINGYILITKLLYMFQLTHFIHASSVGVYKNVPKQETICSFKIPLQKTKPTLHISFFAH